jgi:LCP family protein required for cell wall assembly
VSTTNRRTGSPPSPGVAALLSFVWPGLGQLYAGRRREAAIFGLPIAAIVLLALTWIAGGIERALLDLLAPAAAILFICLVAFDGAWRLAAMLHAVQLPAGREAARRPPTNAVVAGLGLVVLVTHIWAIAVGWSLFEASGRIFPDDVATPNPTEVPATPRPSDGFHATPQVTPETASSRINVLLTGIDASELRTHALTDTLIVVSVDPLTGDVSMVSFPRDIARFTMSNGEVYRQKINSLFTAAEKDPDRYPDGGLPTLLREIGFLLGIPIHYYAAVDLAGFARLVDSVGGVTVDNPRPINDPTYGGWTDGRVGFRLAAGVHHLDGETALAYARSRRGAGDSDFTRARRQQQLLVAIRNRLTDAALLPQLPGVITAGSEVVRTNFPQERLEEMLTVAQGIEGEDGIRRIVLGPPYARNPPAGTPGGYQLVLDMERLAKLSVELYGTDSSYADGGG